MYLIENVSLDRVGTISKTLVEILSAGDIVVLKGDLGSGKTTLVAQYSKEIGCETLATSPTFAIVAEYKLVQPFDSLEKVIHVDTYRLNSVNELFDLGLETFMNDDAITFIEWGDRISQYLAEDYISLEIEETDPDSRTYKIRFDGNWSQKSIDKISEILENNGWKYE